MATLVLGRRRIVWEPPAELNIAITPEISSSTPDIRTQNLVIEVKSGNRHRSLKQRDLEISEKEKIQNGLFLPNNGMITPDLCVQFKARELPAVVAIFQVTGYVTTLHDRVKRGELNVRDKRSYEAYLKEHRDRWATYDSPKYHAMRARAETVETRTQRLPPAPAIFTGKRRTVN